jgi:hypothetical protein
VAAKLMAFLDGLINGIRAAFNGAVAAPGTPAVQRGGLNFVGAGVTLVDNPTLNATDVVIPGGALPLGKVAVSLPNGGAYTMQAQDLGAGLVTFLAGDMGTTVTFPLATSSATAYRRVIQNSTANALTISTSGGGATGPAVGKCATYWFLASGAPLKVTPDT